MIAQITKEILAKMLKVGHFVARMESKVDQRSPKSIGVK